MLTFLFWWFAIGSLIRFGIWVSLPIGRDIGKITVASKFGNIIGSILMLVFLYLINGFI